MTSRQPTSRSSLTRHSFPSFYACYLLKSLQTSKSTATYIGSTPNPPRRIRQHNGEITAGAWKTKHKRPWAMQMIVHGFPSRLAALQFEWAWQHPHISRHLRDRNGKPLFNFSRKVLRTNIQIVRTMISTHPYNTWPLHVKLFTSDAVKHWNDADKNGTMATTLSPLSSSTMGAPLQGFTCSVELEGVDGKSGQVGSGRNGPISVNDEHFTSRYLAKNTALLASGRPLACSVCKKPIHDYGTNHLSSSLCPQPTCTGVAHLLCLSRSFLAPQLSDTDLIPRGGTCPSCNTYILWGDIIRGCYRRASGGTLTEEDEDDEEAGEVFESDDEPNPPALAMTVDRPTQKLRSKTPKSFTHSAAKESVLTAPKKSRTSKGKVKAPSTRRRATEGSSEGEMFDLNVSSVSESESEPTTVKRKRGRPRKVPQTAEPSVGAAPRSGLGTMLSQVGKGTSGRGRLGSLSRSMSSLSLTPAPILEDEPFEISD